MPTRASRHQADQRRLADLLIAELGRLWPNLLLLGLPAAAGAVLALLRPFAQASASLAAEFYDAERAAAGVRTRFTVPVAAPPELDQVAATLGWATRGIRSGRDVDVFDVLEPLRATPLPAALGSPVPQGIGDPAAALEKLAAASQKAVVDTGRLTIAQAVTRDSAATGWARVPTGATTCFFCAMLCTRGAVYLSEESAGRAKDTEFVGAGEFKFHNGDDCIVVPVFEGRDPDIEPETQALIDRWEQLYVESTGAARGKGKVKAFRAAYEAADAPAPAL